MNIQKMRKQQARQTPDRVTKEFDWVASDFDYQRELWIKTFVQSMKVKHGKSFVEIVCYTNDDLAYGFLKKFTLEAKVR